MRIVVLVAALSTAVCPIRMCFGHEARAVTPAGEHGHEDHEGPDSDSGCCVDVPADAHGLWAVLELDLPCVRCAEPVAGPRAPTHPAPAAAPGFDPLRSTVLLR